MLRTPRSCLFVAAMALSLAAPLALMAQTSDVWTNQKISDFRRHHTDSEIDRAANEHMDMANRHLGRVHELTEDDGELSKRKQKKLQKAYERAAQHLEQAIEIEPEWLEPRLNLGALHFQMEAYGEAVRCYQEVLEIQPDHEQARGYLTTAQWYRDRADKHGTDPESGG